jgi:hypothetical protein
MRLPVRSGFRLEAISGARLGKATLFIKGFIGFSLGQRTNFRFRLSESKMIILLLG